MKRENGNIDRPTPPYTLGVNREEKVLQMSVKEKAVRQKRTKCCFVEKGKTLKGRPGKKKRAEQGDEPLRCKRREYDVPLSVEGSSKKKNEREKDR